MRHSACYSEQEFSLSCLYCLFSVRLSLVFVLSRSAWYGAALTIFQILTGENWNEVMYNALECCPVSGVLFFIIVRRTPCARMSARAHTILSNKTVLGEYARSSRACARKCPSARARLCGIQNLQTPKTRANEALRVRRLWLLWIHIPISTVWLHTLHNVLCKSECVFARPARAHIHGRQVVLVGVYLVMNLFIAILCDGFTLFGNDGSGDASVENKSIQIRNQKQVCPRYAGVL